jgi:hypothetical protein
MHVPLQFTSPDWHVTSQFPPEQASPGGHALPHVPQFALSVCVFEQYVPASVVHDVSSPHDTPQLPPLQTRPAPHTFPHAPQLLLSVCSLTQDEPHEVRPDPQYCEHMPELQTWPGLHCFPQPPQLS